MGRKPLDQLLKHLPAAAAVLPGAERCGSTTRLRTIHKECTPNVKIHYLRVKVENGKHVAVPALDLADIVRAMYAHPLLAPFLRSPRPHPCASVVASPQAGVYGARAPCPQQRALFKAGAHNILWAVFIDGPPGGGGAAAGGGGGGGGGGSPAMDPSVGAGPRVPPSGAR
jgi:hypothetical protein